MDAAKEARCGAAPTDDGAARHVPMLGSGWALWEGGGRALPTAWMPSDTAANDLGRSLPTGAARSVDVASAHEPVPRAGATRSSNL
jgi:hypothetical protein